MPVRLRLTLTFALACLFCGLTASCADPDPNAHKVKTVPYLQLAAPHEITIKWRMDKDDPLLKDGQQPDLRVYYRSEAEEQAGKPVRISDKAQWAADLAGPSTITFRVALAGLKPATVYNYQIGVEEKSPIAGTDRYHFKTPPDDGAAVPARIWVIGDSGIAGKSADEVVKAFTDFSPNLADSWLMLGDNAYENGTDDEYEHAVFQSYPTLLPYMPLWPTIGNHDVAQADQSREPEPNGRRVAYYDIFTLDTSHRKDPQRAFPGYYSFNYATVHFICLNAMLYQNPGKDKMKEWLKADLAAAHKNPKLKWTIAYWHHPPYTKGTHDSEESHYWPDAHKRGANGNLWPDGICDPTYKWYQSDYAQPVMRNEIVPILEDAGVDLVLCGHSHVYERSYLLNGNYERIRKDTPINMVDGGSGRDPQPYKQDGKRGTVYVVMGCSCREDTMQGEMKNTAKFGLLHPAMVELSALNGNTDDPERRGRNRLGSLVLDITKDRLNAYYLREDGADDAAFVVQGGAGPVTVKKKGEGLDGGSNTAPCDDYFSIVKP
jgi:3',5'-cyclic AMP phosphodiesterase CpdA